MILTLIDIIHLKSMLTFPLKKHDLNMFVLNVKFV